MSVFPPADALASLAGLGAGAFKASSRPAGPGRAPTAPVETSHELVRIQALPRRSPGDLSPEDLDQLLRLVRRPDGTMSLRPTQARALWEARRVRGGFFPLAVGAGKTLLAALLPTVLDIGPSVILTNAGLVRQGNLMLADYARHWYIRHDIRWVSYGILSSPTQFEILKRISPRLIIADECQNLSAADAARTKRFFRYLGDNPDTLFCAMSGSVTRRSIKDYAKLLWHALRQHSPLPHEFQILQEWAEAVDVSNRPRPPGALLDLMTEEHLATFLHTPVEDKARLEKGRLYLRGAARRAPDPEGEEAAALQDLARDTLRRRLVESHGVVASASNTLEIGLTVGQIPAVMDPTIQETHDKVLQFWERPDGELLTETLELARVSRHVRLGGFYRWVWPRDLDSDAKELWLATRKAYRSALRDFLKHCSAEGLDSPFLVERAIERGDITSRSESAALLLETFPPWKTERERMRAILDRPEPRTEWIWVSRAVAQEAARYTVDHGPLITWVDTTAVGQEIASLAGVPWYGQGEEASEDILREKGDRSIVASIKAHGTGRNLQCFHRALVVAAPTSGTIWEQMLGRLHRPGQTEDVLFEFYDNFAGEFQGALRNAKYQELITGNEQKLLHSERV